MLELTKTYKIESLKDDSAGEIEGYATTYGNVDLVGDIIQKGAFKEWLEKKQSVTLMYGHDDSKIEYILGKATFEDKENGLFFKSKLDFDLPYGNTAYKLLQKGLLDSVSIRFSSDKYSFNKKGNRVFEKGEMKELSLVPFPANPKALITSIKSMSREEILNIRDFEKFLRDSGFSKNEALIICSKGFKGLQSDSAESEDFGELVKMLEKNNEILKRLTKKEIK